MDTAIMSRIFYRRKVLGSYGARRDEVNIGVGSLEVRAVGLTPNFF